jgi:hypothetical protein
MSFTANYKSKIVVCLNIPSPLPKGRGRGRVHYLTVCRPVAHTMSVLAPSLNTVRVLVNEEDALGEPCVRVLSCHTTRESRRSFVRNVGGLDQFAGPVGLKFNYEWIQREKNPTSEEWRYQQQWAVSRQWWKRTSILGGSNRVCEPGIPLYCTELRESIRTRRLTISGSLIPLAM